jgi:hypothetical protein
MAGLSFFLAVMLACASVFFYSAEEARGMAGWANTACSTANTFCQHSEWLAIAALVLLGVALVLRLAT